MTELKRVKEFMETLEFHGYIDHDPTKLDQLIQDYYPLNKALTTPVDVENKELPVYKVVFNEGSDDGVTSINLTKTPLFNAKQTNEHLRSSCDWCNPPQRK
jgi:hypothetical protein